MSQTIKLPGLGEAIDSIEVVKVLVKAGDTLTKEQVILELESGKAVLELPSPVAGKIEKVLVKAGQELKVGAPLMEVAVTDAAEPKPQAAPPEKKTAPTPPTKPVEKKAVSPPPEKTVEKAPSKPEDEPKDRIPAAPLVRRIARQLGVDLHSVTGSGPDGLVTVNDVTGAASKTSVSAAPVDLPKLPRFEAWGEVEREKMSKVRYETARQVTRCWSQIPMVTIFGEADIAKLEEMCDKYAKDASLKGGHLTVAVMIVKIVAEALKVFPQFNASVDMENREFIYKQYYNVGIAVSTQNGLYVPVLKDLDRKNMLEVAADVSAIAKKTRAGKLAPEDLQGGCCTVTNLGNIVGTHFTPLVNYPEVAILGMGRAFTRPAYVKDELQPEDILPLSLSYDHRMIDGADGASFLKWIIQTIEAPDILIP